MIKAIDHSVVETLRDSRSVTIRALKPEDRGAVLSAVERVSSQSLYRRFFGPKRGFTEQETDFFVNVDFVTHVALEAAVDEYGKNTIVGAGRYIVAEPGKAELAFAIIDNYQGLGIGTALLRNLVLITRESGLKQLVADVLPGNALMLRYSGSSDLALRGAGCDGPTRGAGPASGGCHFLRGSNRSGAIG